MKKSLSFLTKYFFPCFSVFFFHRTEMSSGPFQTVTRYQCCRLRTYFGPLPSYLPSFRQLCQTIPTNCKMNYGAWIFFFGSRSEHAFWLGLLFKKSPQGKCNKIQCMHSFFSISIFQFPVFCPGGQDICFPGGILLLAAVLVFFPFLINNKQTVN